MAKKTKRDRELEDAVALLERARLKRPPMYRVLLHNDDYTTQEFVVHILVQFFRKEPGEAIQIMLKAHMTGKSIVGVYTRDVAETRVAIACEYAEQNGHPLLMTVEPDSGGGEEDGET